MNVLYSIKKKEQMWLRLTRLYYKLCLQCTEHAVDRWRRIMWVGEQMQRCHYSSTVSKCEHVQQFPFPNNPPQRPPPLMVFLFLSHSSCQSFSRSPSSRLQLHYRIITAVSPHSMDSVTFVSLSLLRPALFVFSSLLSHHLLPRPPIAMLCMLWYLALRSINISFC